MPEVRARISTRFRLTQSELRLSAKVHEDLGEVPMVKGAQAQMVSLLVNILVNATQALAAGAGSAWVSSAAGAESGTLPASTCDDVVSGGTGPTC